MVAVAMNSLARSRRLLSAELSLPPPPFDLPLLFLLPPSLLPPLPPPLTQLFRETLLLPLSFRLWLNLEARSRGDESSWLKMRGLRC